MSPPWRKLAVNQPALPPLLFQFSWSHEGYVLYVSDLTFVWSEKLSYQEILTRADKISPTIDPNEDLDQFDVLFSRIEEALRGEGGSAALNNGSQADSLQLTTTSKLPAPLRPLEWRIDLMKQPSSSLTDKLLLPLLKDEAGWESRQRVLLEQLKQKDWVLGKMFDKFEALSVDMGTVFPAAAGLRAKKGSTRAEAARVIKGAAPFDETKWLESNSSSSESSGLAAEVLRELVGSENTLNFEKLQAPQDSWWAELQSSSEEISPSNNKDDQKIPEDAPTGPKKEPIVGSYHDMDLDKDGVSTASEDEFERQDTPPRLRAQKKQPPKSSPKSPPKKETKQSPKPPQPDPPLDAGESTASDSEPEPEPEPSVHTHRAHTPPKADPAPDIKSPETKAPEPEKTKSPEPEIKSPEPQKKKPKGGLGVIGGKKKKEEKPTSAPAEPPSTEGKSEEPSAAPKPKRTKLGMIGGKSKNKAPAPSASPPPAQKEESREAPAVTEEEPLKQEEPVKEEIKGKKEATPVPEETEEEKAKRRREELKRQLAEKSKAPKKKRRL